MSIYEKVYAIAISFVITILPAGFILVSMFGMFVAISPSGSMRFAATVTDATDVLTGNMPEGKLNYSQTDNLYRRYIHTFIESELEGVISNRYFNVVAQGRFLAGSTDRIILTNSFFDRFYEYLISLGYPVNRATVRTMGIHFLSQAQLKHLVDI